MTLKGNNNKKEELMHSGVFLNIVISVAGYTVLYRVKKVRHFGDCLLESCADCVCSFAWIKEFSASPCIVAIVVAEFSVTLQP